MATLVMTDTQTTRWSRSRPLATRFAWAVVAYNILVIVWGALVRATGSGAGCGNHWPLCNGVVIPVSPGIHTLIEFTHRSMTGGAAFAVLGLLWWTFRSTTKGQAARASAVVATVLLLNEALLGALLVKLGYVTTNQSVGRVVMLSVHLSNTLLLLAALTLTAYLLRTGQRWREFHVARSTAAWTIAGLASTLVVAVSGSLAALGDTLFPSASLSSAVAADFATGSPWLIRVRWVHPVSALLAATFVLGLVRRASHAGVAPKLVRTIALLLAAQFVLGIADVLLLAPVWLQLLHLLGADLYWVALVTLAAQVASQRQTGRSSAQNAPAETVPSAH